jgi:hypothetical protein
VPANKLFTQLSCFLFSCCCLQTGEQRQVRHRHKSGTADIHLIGEITGAVGFGAEPLYCTWQLVYDEQLWAVTKGLTKVR